MQLHEKIKALRIDNDRTQKEVAAFLGIDQSYYAKYENGKHPIPTWHLERLCLYYHVSSDYLLGLPRGLQWPR